MESYQARLAHRVVRDILIHQEPGSWYDRVNFDLFLQLDDEGRQYVRQHVNEIRMHPVEFFQEPGLGGVVLASPWNMQRWRDAVRSRHLQTEIASTQYSPLQTSFQTVSPSTSMVRNSATNSWMNPRRNLGTQSSMSLQPNFGIHPSLNPPHNLGVQSSMNLQPNFGEHSSINPARNLGAQSSTNLQHDLVARVSVDTNQHVNHTLRQLQHQTSEPIRMQQLRVESESQITNYPRLPEVSNHLPTATAGAPPTKAGSNPFMEYRMAQLEEYKREYPHLTSSEHSKLIAERWWSLSDEECHKWFVIHAQKTGGKVGKRGDRARAEKRRLARRNKSSARTRNSTQQGAPSSQQHQQHLGDPSSKAASDKSQTTGVAQCLLDPVENTNFKLQGATHRPISNTNQGSWNYQRSVASEFLNTGRVTADNTILASHVPQDNHYLVNNDRNAEHIKGTIVVAMNTPQEADLPTNEDRVVANVVEADTMAVDDPSESELLANENQIIASVTDADAMVVDDPQKNESLANEDQSEGTSDNPFSVYPPPPTGHGGMMGRWERDFSHHRPAIMVSSYSSAMEVDSIEDSAVNFRDWLTLSDDEDENGDVHITSS
ncbi:hypothetical protein F5Y16DRAFT_400825 [Xylariaceae sp. FL0255]|nr:hypothetical protein F5Y16DRAFT_400825 [Xylariaceae sp. FL0255]